METSTEHEDIVIKVEPEDIISDGDKETLLNADEPVNLTTKKTTTASKVSYTVLTDKERAILCQKKQDEGNITQQELAKWAELQFGFKVSQATISNTLKRSAQLLADTSSGNRDVKRHKAVKYPLMENALSQWLQTHQSPRAVSGDVLKAKGAFFLQRLYPNAETFEFSNGWLDRFKFRFKRNSRSCRKLGQSDSAVDVGLSEDERYRKVLDKYEWCDIYNVDETAIFYRMQADNNSLEGCNERMTAVVCCNGDGSDKLPLWIIGKVQNPRCLKNINAENLGCTYRANCGACVTPAVFLEWIEWFDGKMDGRKVVLFMDNCCAHNLLPKLHNTRVLYPATKNTTAGITRLLKAYYCCRLKRKLMDSIEGKISILDGIQLAATAWDHDLKPQTISNCFIRRGIRTPAPGEATVITEDMVENDEESQLSKTVDWDDSTEQVKVELRDAKAALDTVHLFLLQQTDNRTEQLTMVRILKDAVSGFT